MSHFSCFGHRISYSRIGFARKNIKVSTNLLYNSQNFKKLNQEKMYFKTKDIATTPKLCTLAVHGYWQIEETENTSC